jgi:hypothetical protein
MTATKTQLTGGVFQDSEGNVLNKGYLLLKLNQDNNVSGVGNVCAGIEVKIALNSSGSVDTITPQFIWATDVMTVINAFYTVTGYTSQGQRAWGPNNQQVTSGGIGGGTFDCGLWVPNQVYSWTPQIQPLTLKTNSVLNASQTLLNLVAGSNLSATDGGNGTVTLAVTGITGITLKTNGTPNSSQTLLNLVAGTGITLAEASGAVTISNAGGPVAAGTNVIQLPSWGGNSVWVENGVDGGTVNTAGGTIFEQITSGMFLCFPSRWKVTIETFSASTVITMVVIKCNRGTGTVVSTTAVTFSGSATPTLAPAGKYQSDSINFPFVQGFDYYFALNTSTNLVNTVAPGSNQVGTANGGVRVTNSNALPIGGTLPSWVGSLTEASNHIIWDLVSA